ncbi:YggS family pyridoxal phosphate-dependent enzyme [Flagellimonas pelagia]|uniref:Pyridoxal phosphate homeostasis protein n=1 Tax=Flagellimonas pelagia TaxID=2306998 RepID=A0A3A1NCF7_9FLAO|nr:YggS family pyridoxal phosphate-dependent enzyme [Allomuricauda maritima]RIV42016.1 YggS family pyridoxal phosphate-dependent enzyme [Allomuricauda maritima]TXJ90897.1 YggS family pyridoxal phosphate-dependent enzyme [Allomuricauda maritima]
MSIVNNIKSILAEIPEGVVLVAVSKTKPKEALLEAYEAGQRVFGENKVQEMVGKWELLPKDIEWHMIGHLQRNKVKYMAEFVSLIHGVDSLKLLIEIDKQAQKYGRVIPCLLQMHIAEEDTKFGLDEQELNELIASDEFQTMENIKVVGLMGMATFTSDEVQIRKEFAHLKSIFENLKQKLPGISILSMGMSGDYQLAIEEGSTMVRIGSSIFGSRNYS